MYHSIDDSAAAMSVSPTTFRAQMRCLKEKGHHVLSLMEFVSLLQSGREVSKKSVVLTFDDGFANNLTVALPVLKEFGLTATVFIATGYVGDSSVEGQSNYLGLPTLTWSQIRQLSEEGIEIGAHTISHPRLNQIPLQAARKEISDCKKTLETHLRKPIFSFAYPHGHYNQSVRDCVEETGFGAACTIEPGTVQYGGDPFLLKRVYVRDDMSKGEFRASLTAAIDWYILLQKAILRPGFSKVRVGPDLLDSGVERLDHFKD